MERNSLKRWQYTDKCWLCFFPFSVSFSFENSCRTLRHAAFTFLFYSHSHPSFYAGWWLWAAWAERQANPNYEGLPFYTYRIKFLCPLLSCTCGIWTVWSNWHTGTFWWGLKPDETFPRDRSELGLTVQRESRVSPILLMIQKSFLGTWYSFLKQRAEENWRTDILMLLPPRVSHT